MRQLGKKLGPVQNPFETDGDWSSVEAELGLALPADYKEFIGSYGTGVIGNWLTVLNPFAKSPKANLVTINQGQEQKYSDREREGIPVPFVTWPYPGGLLLWGKTNTGIDLHWITARAPDKWSVAVCHLRDMAYWAFPLSMSGLIEDIINDALWPRAVRPNVFIGPPKFVPDQAPLG